MWVMWVSCGSRTGGDPHDAGRLQGGSESPMWAMWVSLSLNIICMYMGIYRRLLAIPTHPHAPTTPTRPT